MKVSQSILVRTNGRTKWQKWSYPLPSDLTQLAKSARLQAERSDEDEMFDLAREGLRYAVEPRRGNLGGTIALDGLKAKNFRRASDSIVRLDDRRDSVQDEEERENLAPTTVAEEVIGLM